jgi:hypothetical protein
VLSARSLLLDGIRHILAVRRPNRVRAFRNQTRLFISTDTDNIYPYVLLVLALFANTFIGKPAAVWRPDKRRRT